MTILSEGKHAEAFLVSEGPHTRSREVITILAGSGSDRVLTSGMVLGLIFAAVGVRFLTTLAIAGWATYTTGILLLLLGQLGAACLLFAFMTLSGRTMVRFLPKRDYVHYIRNRTRVYPADEGR